MKKLLLFIPLLMISSPKSSQFNYDLLIGNWSQKSFANTASTGVFNFKKDSTANLEMRNGETDALIGGMVGKYSINKAKGVITVTMMGKAKEFEIQELSKDVLIFQNKKEGKEKQIFKRIDE